MAVTVTSQMTTISACENDAASWSSHNRAGTAGALSAIQLSDEEAPPREGTYCNGFDLDIENGGYYFAITAADYSAKMIYMWGFALTAANLDTFALGGVYIIAKEGANYGYWYVGGADTYKGGWKCFVADLSRAPDANNGTAPNMSLCDGVGIGFKSLAKSKASHNMYFDFMREADLGDGILVETTASSVATWDDVFSGDDTAAAGVIGEEGGVYFVQGPITFGDATGGDCEFADSSQLIVFADSDVIAGHYEIKIEGTGAGVIEFEMGVPAGVRGISGCTLKTATLISEPFHITATDTDIDVFKLYGCNFIGVGTVSLPPTTASREVISCNFEAGAEILPDTCIVKYCNIIDADDRGLRFSSTSHNVTLCTFINCPAAIHIPAAGTYGMAGIVFIGSDGGTGSFDIDNSGNSAAVIINASTLDGVASNPVYAEETGTPPGTTSIVNTKTLTVTVKDQATPPAGVEGVRVRIEKQSDGSEVSQGETNASGIYSDATYNYVGDVPVFVKARLLGFQYVKTATDITSEGLDVPITLIADDIVNRP